MLDNEVEELISFLKEYNYNDLVENDKIIIRQYLRSRKDSEYIDSYALDYTEDSFRVSIIKKEERIVLVTKGDVTIWK